MPDKRQAGPRKASGSALEKALRVLEALTEQPQAIGLSDLTARVGLPRQTVHRVLQQLEDNRLVIRDSARDCYVVGARLSKLAMLALHSANQGAPMRVILQDLVDDIAETCNIGVLDGLDMVYLERIECDWPLRIHLMAGSRVPAHCTSGGKVMLAHLPATLRARLLKSGRLKAYTPNSITSPTRLEAEFTAIRDNGYAVNDQELHAGIVGVAVPVPADGRMPRAALAMHAPVARVSLARALEQLPKLRDAAKRLAGVWRLDDALDTTP